MQERLVLVNHLSTGSIARRLLFQMVTKKPPKFNIEKLVFNKYMKLAIS